VIVEEFFEITKEDDKTREKKSSEIPCDLVLLDAGKDPNIVIMEFYI
jgi:hypothetical protein